MAALLLRFLALAFPWVVFATDIPFQYASPAFTSVRSACKTIPNTLSLCHGIGYKEMRLPNLLGHDTMKEVQQQSGSWVPLISKQCHRDTKKFLCSLFAPVCLPELSEPVRPCRALCEDVRDGCLPVMSAFGFPWPDMFNCSQFPSGGDLCIPATGSTGAKDYGGYGSTSDLEGTVVCDACSLENEGEKEIRLNYCKSHFVVRFRLGESSVEGADRRIVALGRSHVLTRVRERKDDGRVANNALWLPEGGSCACQELDNPTAASVVALGNFEGGRLVLSRLMKWTRTDRELRKFIRSLQRLLC
ncbi:secreted frizzled-related protein 2-like [Megalops cyprinoides]|uniref:secreted frizzled-related protein 2-like n=1 Tax=Megalops cyprinoides TaxID=118141 RepID=UPI001863E44C|nr:secreted frizzled-related protein 2-like [Megalops cyprinoides]